MSSVTRRDSDSSQSSQLRRLDFLHSPTATEETLSADTLSIYSNNRWVPGAWLYLLSRTCSCTMSLKLRKTLETWSSIFLECCIWNLQLRKRPVARGSDSLTSTELYYSWDTGYFWTHFLQLLLDGLIALIERYLVRSFADFQFIVILQNSVILIFIFGCYSVATRINNAVHVII